MNSSKEIMESLKPAYFYHIYNHAVGDELLFRKEENYNYFLKLYGNYIPLIAKTYAYCLMPNHFHLMIGILSDNEIRQHHQQLLYKSEQKYTSTDYLISKSFSNLFNAYTKAYNKLYSRQGSLFRKRFKRKTIDHKKYGEQLVAYIHYNPVQHGFVSSPNQWPFSSWNAYTTDKTTGVSRDTVISWFGDKKSFFEYHRNFKPSPIIEFD